MSSSAPSSLPALSSLPLSDFIAFLNTRHALGLSAAEIERSAEVLKDQWFTVAEELRMVDMEAFNFLPLPKQLPTAIHAFFSPNYNPNELFPPGQSRSSASSASPPPPALPSSPQSQQTTSHGDEDRPRMQSVSRAGNEGLLNATPSSSSASSSSSSSASVAASNPVTNGFNLAALEGGIIEDGEGSHEASQISDGEGGHSSSGSDDGDDSGSGDDADMVIVDGAQGNGKKKKKKWDRHSSLLALKRAVDHVCAGSTRDEHVVTSLQNILKDAMQKSGKNTQNTLRELMKKLQDKLNELPTDQAQTPAAAVSVAAADALPSADDGLAMRMKSLSVGSDMKPSVTPPPSLPLSSSSSYSSSSSSSSSAFGFLCGICHGAKEKAVQLECGHKFDPSCVSEYINGLVGQKQAIGIKCPFSAGSASAGGACSYELSTAIIQSLLAPADFENYLNATLMSFIESDDCLTVTCPNPKCGSLMSVEPLKNPRVPNPITEKDDDGRLLTKETYLHFIEFRVRCRDCSTNFCAKCRAVPYHKNYTCSSFKEYQASRHCRFCSTKLTTEQANKLSNGVRDVCTEKECQDKSLICCEKMLECGCPCQGIKNESECLPCLKHELKIEEDEYCSICFIEGLKDAPCVQLKGECGHIFHYACLKQKLEAKWPGARIGFEFKGCPVCKREISHPSLEPVLAPINALEADIKERALQRLKFEGRDKDPAIINESGSYYNDPTGFAMKQYLFYICYTCKKPYFAGGYQCFDESHQILTKQGFMFVDQLEQAVKSHTLDVATYNPQSQCIEYHPLSRERLITKAFADDGGPHQMIELMSSDEANNWNEESDEFGSKSRMDSFNSSHVTLRVTDDHAMHVRFGRKPEGQSDIDWNESQHCQKDSCYSSATAAELTDLADGQKAVKLLAAAANGVDVTRDDITPQLIQRLDLAVPSDPSVEQDHVNTFLELYGFWLGGGQLAFHSSHLPEHNYFAHLISRLPNPARLEAFFAAEYAGHHSSPSTRSHSPSSLAACNATRAIPSHIDQLLSSTDDEQSSSDESDDDEKKQVDYCIGAPTSRSPRWFWRIVLRRLSKPQLRLLLSGLEAASQASPSHSLKSSGVIETTSTRLRDELLVACLHAGYTAHFTAAPDTISIDSSNESNAEGKQTRWLVQYSCSEVDTEPTLYASREITQRLLHGRVWCVDMPPHHLVVVRRAQANSNGEITKASRPIITGQCQEANQAFDPAELICPACQPSSVEDCATHGRDWLAYKCRYCCSFANWTCWGSTHFCDKCHKSGVWQTLAVFRTGKNKKKLWEYEQCSSLQKAVEAIGRENISEDEKNAKIGKLLSAPRSCPLGVRHPPNGIEFGLGCSMCSDNQSIGDAAAAAESVRARLTVVKAELTKAPKVFIPEADFDQNGVFWYLGTCGKTQVWTNPAEAGFVKIGCSGAMTDSAPLSALVGRELVRLVSQPQRNSWFTWELIDVQLSLTHYTLKHYNSWDTECLRSWTIEGSNDGGSHWETISVHTNDQSLNKKGATCTWKVDSRGRKYSMFRIFQTGRNSNNNFYLALSGSEFYGELSLAPAGSASHAPAANRVQFSPRTDFDTNGLMYYLGTKCGKQPWRNPAEMGDVIVVCSELAPGPPPSEPTSAVVGRETVRCVSAAKPNQWFVIDITPSGKRIKPSHYSLRHYSSWDLEALRNWRFEGSANGVDWYVLSVHSNDSSLDRKGATHTWALPGCQIVCSMFRIWQTGLNSNNHHYLACSGFEVYGTLEEAPQVFPQQQRFAGGFMPNQPPPHAGGYPGVQPQAAHWQGGYQPMPQPLPLQMPPPPMPPNMSSWVAPTPLLPLGAPNSSDSGLVILRYQHDMDQNGAMQYLGSMGRRLQWRNPADIGEVSVRCSELATNPPSMPASAICGQEAVRCCTVGKPDMWYIIDFKAKAVALTHYTLRHYTSWDVEALRNWRLEGSNDGVRWDLLRQHVNDKSLNAKGQTATWPVLGASDRFYHMFKVTQTGLNSNNNHYMALSGFEVYGLLQLWPNSGTPEAKAQQSAIQQSGMKGDTVDAVRNFQQQIKLQFAAAPAGNYNNQPQYLMQPPQPQANMNQPSNPLLAALPPVQANQGGGMQAGMAAAFNPPSQAAAASSALVPASKMGPPAYQEFFDGMEFVYQADMDCNGILYWLGTQRWTKPWQNPADIGACVVTSVPLAIQPKSEPASAVVGRTLCRCVTLPNRESWFIIDLVNVWVRPTAYTLRHYDSWDTEALRDWKLQGSNDGKKWTKLLSHKKDESLNKKGAVKTWAIPKPKKAFQMFRILQTGKNSNQHWYLALGGNFELYGKVYSYRKS